MESLESHQAAELSLNVELQVARRQLQVQMKELESPESYRYQLEVFRKEVQEKQQEIKELQSQCSELRSAAENAERSRGAYELCNQEAQEGRLQLLDKYVE